MEVIVEARSSCLGRVAPSKLLRPCRTPSRGSGSRSPVWRMAGKEVADSKPKSKSKSKPKSKSKSKPKPKPKSKSKSKPKMSSYDMMMKNYNKKKESGPPFNIKTAWLAHYKANGGGSFKMHGDRAAFDYRVIYSWGESKPGKWMVIQSKLDGHWCGFRVPHGTGVGMTPLCAGYGLNAFHHGVHGAEGTNTLGFDLKM